MPRQQWLISVSMPLDQGLQPLSLRDLVLGRDHGSSSSPWKCPGRGREGIQAAPPAQPSSLTLGMVTSSFKMGIIHISQVCPGLN